MTMFLVTQLLVTIRLLVISLLMHRSKVTSVWGKASCNPGRRKKGWRCYLWNEFPKYKESSLILYPSFVLVLQTGNQRDSFNLVSLTLLHRYNHVYVVSVTATCPFTFISILLISIRLMFLNYCFGICRVLICFPWDVC